MNKYHQEILEELKKFTPKKDEQELLQKYHGTNETFYSIRVPEKRELMKNFVKSHKDLSFEEYVELVDSLFHGKSYQEKTMASHLFEYMPKLRKQLKVTQLKSWLEYNRGWAQIDSFCQSTFTPEEMLYDWYSWKKFLTELSSDKNINKRRASLVFLTRAVEKSDDKRLAKIAFQNIKKLQHEKDILITKAVSWLLRSLIKNHKKVVEYYLQKNAAKLPKIAIRETMTKLKTGIKGKGRRNIY